MVRKEGIKKGVFMWFSSVICDRPVKIVDVTDGYCYYIDFDDFKSSLSFEN
jgi:hypothetical protein